MDGCLRIRPLTHHLLSDTFRGDLTKYRYYKPAQEMWCEVGPSMHINPIGFIGCQGSDVILSLQEGKLSVTCERMCTEYWLSA